MIAGRWTAKVRFEGDADQAENRSLGFRVNMRRLVHCLTCPLVPPFMDRPALDHEPRLSDQLSDDRGAHQRTLTDTQAQAGHGIAQHGGP